MYGTLLVYIEFEVHKVPDAPRFPNRQTGLIGKQLYYPKFYCVPESMQYFMF